MTKIHRLPGLVARRVAHSVKAVLCEADGFASLEFGILSPLMFFTLFVASDISNALEVSRRMTVAATTIAELASQVSNGSTVTGTMTDAELTLILNSIVTTFPDVLSDAASQQINWQSDIEAIVTHVVIGPSATCNVDPDVADLTPTTPVCNTSTPTWSVGFNNGNFPAKNRNCGVGALTNSGTNTGNPTLTTLPPGLYSPGSVLVVDLFYHYTPMFTKWITGTLTFQRTAYIAPRFFYQLSYTNPGTSSFSFCTYTGPLP